MRAEIQFIIFAFNVAQIDKSIDGDDDKNMMLEVKNLSIVMLFKIY